MDSETRVKEAVTAVAAEQKVRKYTVSPHNSFSFSKMELRVVPCLLSRSVYCRLCSLASRNRGATPSLGHGTRVRILATGSDTQLP